MQVTRLLLILTAALLLAGADARLGGPPAAQAAFPGDNGKIAFVSSGRIKTMNPDGSGVADLAAGQRPNWSADGKKIVYWNAVGSQSEVFVMNEDGTGQTNITNNPALDIQGNWSPDGTQIVFLSSRADNDHFQVWVMNADGSNPHQVTTFGYLDDNAQPTWSPDGTKILFGGIEDAGSAQGYDLYTIAPDGSGVTNITNTPSELGTTGNWNFEGQPDWSPDGTKIAYLGVHLPGGNNEIYVIDANSSGNRQRLTDNPGFDVRPSWSADGSKISFGSFRNGGFSLYEMNADGSNQHPLPGGAGAVESDWQPLDNLVRVEFTQAVQDLQSVPALKADLAGDGAPPVPIVAGKPAAMRVYFEEVDQTTQYAVQVSGEFSDTENVTLDPGCTPIDRRRQSGGCTSVDFFFTPPQGQWSVRLVVTDFGGATVLDEEFQLTSVNTAEFSVKYLPICVKLTPGAAATCPTGFIDTQASDLMSRLFPVAEDEFHYDRLPVPSLTLDAPVPDYAGATDLVADLRLLYNLMSIGNLAPDQLAGWLPAGGSPAFLGISDPAWLGSTGRVSWQVDTSASDLLDPQATFAHEIGHNLGLRHTNLPDGCGASDSNTDWPYPDSTIQEVGFDVEQGQAKLETKMDMMSYCSPPGTNIWISPHSYTKLINGDLQPQAVAAVPAGAASGQFLLIRGDAQADGSSGNLGSAYVITSSIPAEPPDPQGNHCLHFTGGDEADYCFTLEFEDHRTHAPADSESFALKVPLPPGTTRVALMHGADELASMEASASGPTLEITSPANGESWSGAQTVAWSGSDGDGDDLTYAILYSPDGGATWYPLAADSDAAELSLDTSDLQPGDNVLFRVLASDGLNTTDETVGPITVASHLSGDVDCSGGVNSIDALKLSRHVAGLSVAQTEPCPDIGTGGGDVFGDVNCDGSITAVDALFVLRFVAGMPVNLPQGCKPVGT